jgi:hypothetical protein
MGTMRRSHRYSLIAAALLAAACQPTTAPDIGLTFDSDATLSAYQSMDSLMASPELAAFAALSGRTAFGGPAGVDVAGAFASAAGADPGRGFALALASRLQEASLSSGGPAATAIISDFTRGVTFVYDADTDQYVADAERDGAPATGVRLVLYEVDLLGRPVSDEEIGYADFVDLGDGSVEDVVLHLTVVAHGTTVLEYGISVDFRLNGGTLGVDGALQDLAGRRLDFDVEVTWTPVVGATTIDAEFELRVDARDFSINGTLSGIEEGTEGEGSIEILVEQGTDSIHLDVDGAGGQLDGSVSVNGALFATIIGDASDPVIASASGEALTFREFLVLRRIIDGAEDIFDLLEDLLDPVDEILVLAIIL